jgi:hypothetical protein
VDLVTGNLLAARGSLSTESAIFNPWLNRKAALGVQVEVLAGESGGLEASATLSGAFAAVKEKHATRDKVQALLDDYAESLGMKPTDVRLMLAEPGGPAAKAFWRGLTLSIPVGLNTAQWGLFTSRDPAQVDRSALATALPLFARRYANDSLFQNGGPIAELRGFASKALEKEVIGEADLLAYFERFPQRYVGILQAPSFANDLGIDATSSGVSDPGTRRFLIVHRLARTVVAPGRLQALARRVGATVAASATPVNPARLRRDLDDVLKAMQEVLAPVALVSETWLGKGLGGADDEPVSWPFVSFVTTMARLGGLAVPPGFVPVAQTGDAPPVKLIPPA